MNDSKYFKAVRKKINLRPALPLFFIRGGGKKLNYAGSRVWGEKKRKKKEKKKKKKNNMKIRSSVRTGEADKSRYRGVPGVEKKSKNLLQRLANSVRAIHVWCQERNGERIFLIAVRRQEKGGKGHHDLALKKGKLKKKKGK